MSKTTIFTILTVIATIIPIVYAIVDISVTLEDIKVRGINNSLVLEILLDK